MKSYARDAIGDIVRGAGRWELWTSLGWNDIQKRYRRAVFGPMWVTLSLAIFVLVPGPLYSELMGRDLSEYVPHLILGLLAWNLLSKSMAEGCRAFLDGVH